MKRFAIATATLALAVVPAATALAKTSSHAVRHTRTTRPAGESGHPVIDWNQALLSIVNTPGAQPANVQPTWDFAVMHAAIYDAVDSIDRSHDPYADQRACASRRIRDRGGRRRRAHARCRALPGAAERARRRLRRRARPGARRAREGSGCARRRAGRPRPARDPRRRRLERRIAAVRPGDDPGSYQPTPPNFAAPVFSTWGQRHAVRARQRRPVPARAATGADESTSTPRRSTRCRASARRPARPARPTRP